MSRWIERDGDLVLEGRDNAELLADKPGIDLTAEAPRPVTALTFGWESCAELFREPNIMDLLKAHHQELGLHHDACPLDPDFNRYIALEALGIFRTWAARSGPTLAGYISFFVQPNLHYKSTIHATEDLFMLAAPYRKGTNGIRMWRTAIDALRELGVKRMIVHSKVHFEAERGGLGKFFKRLGFEHTDSLYIRLL